MGKKKKIEIAVQGAISETVARFSKAVKEHVVSYSGSDHEKEKKLKRGLRIISESKTADDPHMRAVNIKQQAGFSFEVKTVARENADAIIQGKRERSIRTDDIAQTQTTNGYSIGGTNDPIADIVSIDPTGSFIQGSARQLKFVGSDPETCTEGLLGKDFDKYRDAGVRIEIPSDFYPGVCDSLDKKINDLQKEIEENAGRWDPSTLEKKQNELIRQRRTRELIKKGKLTSKEAIEARLHPRISVAKDIVSVSHKAGIEGAKIGAVVSGAIAIVQNIVYCVKGEKEPQTAAADVLKQTGKGTVNGYVASFSGAAINGIMRNSSSQYVRAISHTNLASGLVSTTMNVVKTVNKYITGQLSGAQCVEELGEQGVGEIGAALYSTIALASVKGVSSAAIKVIAGLAGSTFGYAAAVAVYQELSTALKEYELAKEERISVEQECQEAVKLILQYRQEMNDIIEHKLSQYYGSISDGFRSMDEAIIANDADGFIAGNAIIQQCLGRTSQFSTQSEFDDLMLSNEALKL